MDFFNKTKGIKSVKQKFNYIKNHYKYFTMNSWNKLQSIANNVKLDKLGLSNEQFNKAYDIISVENKNNCFWEDVQIQINAHNLRIGFNGRNSGYIVLYNKENNDTILSEIFEYDDIQDFIADKKDIYKYTYKEAFAEAKYLIEKDFETVKEFDEMCDEIRDLLLYYIDNYEVKEEEIQITKTIKVLVYKGE